MKVNTGYSDEKVAGVTTHGSTVSLSDWVAGARPRTLPAAVVPVLVGTGVAAVYDGFSAWRAGMALLVALALQVGVNYANDYSDGIRGTDDARVGPMRLVASRRATPVAVRNAALLSFCVAMLSGLILTVAAGSWWLLLIGLLSVVAAWTYTGGPKPYGYHALGEIAVFVFFGLVAVMGTTYVQLERIPLLALMLAIAVGFLACALLVVNNLRDIQGDADADKRTMAVVLGARRTRILYTSLIIGAFVIVALGAIWFGWLLLIVVGGALAGRPIRRVLGGATGPQLITALQETARLQLAFGILLTAALVLSA